MDWRQHRGWYEDMAVSGAGRDWKQGRSWIPDGIHRQLHFGPDDSADRWYAEYQDSDSTYVPRDQMGYGLLTYRDWYAAYVIHVADKIHYMGDGNLGPRGGRLYVFHCPGCGYGHPFEIGAPNNEGWDWNGSMDKPTFRPSLLVNKDYPEMRCHSFVTEGRIQFLSDCFHKLADQTVELPDWE